MAFLKLSILSGSQKFYFDSRRNVRTHLQCLELHCGSKFTDAKNSDRSKCKKTNCVSRLHLKVYRSRFKGWILQIHVRCVNSSIYIYAELWIIFILLVLKRAWNGKPYLQGTAGPIRTRHYWSESLTPNKSDKSMCSWSKFSIYTHLARIARLVHRHAALLKSIYHSSHAACKSFIPLLKKLIIWRLPKIQLLYYNI